MFANENLTISQLLLDKKANVNVKNKHNETPLYYAVSNGHTEIFKLLLNKEININSQSEDGNKFLNQAVRNDYL